MNMKLLLAASFLLCLFEQFQCICKLEEHTDDEDVKKHEEQLLQRIRPLHGLEFHVEDEKYTYHVRICDVVKGYSDNAGAVQVDKSGKTHILGTVDKADIMGGTNWILLTYLNGTEYNSHCQASDRTTQIMIICNPENVKGEFSVLEEKRKNSSSHCSYWFEFGSSIACDLMEKGSDTPQRLSSGSVFCIILFTFLATYLLLGFLYKRLVVGSKGLEQIPNYTFWRAFGNLQADACDFICRCGPRQESQAYRGIDDRLKNEELDDQLLNM